jgi:hypothetical protein
MKSKNKMNVRLLRKIARSVLKYYKQVGMENWFSGASSAGRCGTSACIAGWAITLHNPKFKERPLDAAVSLDPEFKGVFYMTTNAMNTAQLDGQRALGLTDEQADKLFFSVNWPMRFRERVRFVDFREPYRPGTKRYARAVHDRIQYFIATKGEE